MLSGERLLIVEEEFLIAMDIQRVLEEANAINVVFARNYRELAALEPRFGEFDLAIVTPPQAGAAEAALAAKLAHSGPALVICSATPVNTAGTELAVAEIVHKPFADDDLLAACKRALAKRKPA